MDKITGKEGKGVKGTGFSGGTGSNSYSALPGSSNANMGIDADVAAGYGDAVTGQAKGGGQNVGDKGHQASSRAGLGYDEDWATGTVGARENMGGIGPADDRGVFGTSAKSGGHSEGSTSSTLGSGARAKGTAGSETGVPGRSGSMALAFKGLSGSTGGGIAPAESTRDLTTDRTAAIKGMKGSGGKQ